MTHRQQPKRKRAKFTNSAKVTLAALSVMGFIGGWDLIARLDTNREAQASGNLPPASPPANEPVIIPTPWPTIPPLAELPLIPTLAPTHTTAGQMASTQPGSQGDTLAIPQDNAPAQIAPVPTLAPLPTMAPLPTLPPPPPPPPAQTWNGGGNFSGGS
jgi:hypothetical protein